jgi:hypothetical protein
MKMLDSSQNKIDGLSNRDTNVTISEIALRCRIYDFLISPEIVYGYPAPSSFPSA